ncbi:hypothetical protein CR513_01694, partial [Mucuna pruriens]
MVGQGQNHQEGLKYVKTIVLGGPMRPLLHHNLPMRTPNKEHAPSKQNNIPKREASKSPTLLIANTLLTTLDLDLEEVGYTNIMYQPWCIRYLELEQAQSYELKYGLIHLLPKFHGLVGNIQQFGVREFAASRVVNEILKNKITEMTSLVRQLAIRQHQISPLMAMNNIQFQENVFDTSQDIQT